MTMNIKQFEARKYSQNGEDGVLAELLQRLTIRENNFIEIGCSDGVQNNSRGLIEAGLVGACVDCQVINILNYEALLKSLPIEGVVQLFAMKVSMKNYWEILDWYGFSPDIFSLDIDSYDFFVADGLLRLGFRPSIVCVEVNTFLGASSITIDYSEELTRYQFDPDYGLYFGASPNAWRYLWGRYGYRSLGLESTCTNMFFGLPERFSNRLAEFQDREDSHQSYYEKKYKMTGRELSKALLENRNLKFLNVDSVSYLDRFNRLVA